MSQTFVNKIAALTHSEGIKRSSAPGGEKQTSKPTHCQRKGGFVGENSRIFRHGEGAAGETMMKKSTNLVLPTARVTKNGTKTF